jgi:hypothetical protein
MGRGGHNPNNAAAALAPFSVIDRTARLDV